MSLSNFITFYLPLIAILLFVILFGFLNERKNSLFVQVIKDEPWLIVPPFILIIGPYLLFIALISTSDRILDLFVGYDYVLESDEKLIASNFDFSPDEARIMYLSDKSKKISITDLEGQFQEFFSLPHTAEEIDLIRDLEWIKNESISYILLNSIYIYDFEDQILNEIFHTPLSIKDKCWANNSSILFITEAKVSGSLLAFSPETGTGTKISSDNREKLACSEYSPEVFLENGLIFSILDDERVDMYDTNSARNKSVASYQSTESSVFALKRGKGSKSPDCIVYERLSTGSIYPISFHKQVEDFVFSPSSSLLLVEHKDGISNGSILRSIQLEFLDDFELKPTGLADRCYRYFDLWQ